MNPYSAFVFVAVVGTLPLPRPARAGDGDGVVSGVDLAEFHPSGTFLRLRRQRLEVSAAQADGATLRIYHWVN